VIRRFLDQPVWVRVLRGIALAAVVALATVYTPTPYHLQAPGRAVPVSSIIRIRKQRLYPINGEFLMTTVLAEKASVLLCIYGLLDPAASLTREGPRPEGEHAQSPPGVEGSPEGDDQMGLSQYLSTWVALEKLGYKVRGQYKGLLIVGVNRSSANLDRLRPGDLIVEMQGKSLPDLEGFKAVLGRQHPGGVVKTVLVRQGKRLAIDLEVTEVDGKMRIGTLLRPEYGRVQLPVEVDFSSGNTVGASGGLVFALEIYDQLSPQDLARGRVIAATGTLDGGGRVGPIEGVSFKLIGAERAGASVFLVPRENWPEIQNAETSMKVVPVETFQEALDALR
jgi:PDZ domain-containing protein